MSFYSLNFSSILDGTIAILYISGFWLYLVIDCLIAVVWVASPILRVVWGSIVYLHLDVDTSSHLLVLSS